ncbi:MAG TPA: malto-oligosyltrehalose synthase [Gillisia sp.]|nr:malto-oligosyltrehalose synthase [Gillisia sp.]
MKRPDTTYRLQISPQFTFKDLDRILDYLDDLGITTIYSAPFFQAKEGSTHGYDVLDPFIINRDIGDLSHFQEISQRLVQKNMSWLQDIVPNHMAFDSKNPWLRDIFELGPRSRYYNFFDIDWDFKGLHKVMVPFLGDTLEEVLNKKELKLQLNQGGLFFKYYENEYPLSLETYQFLFSKSGFESLSNKVAGFDHNDQNWNELKKEILKELFKPSTEQRIHNLIEEINNSQKEIKEILDLQFFLPTYWQKTETEINYRRFFTINGLICLRMEDPVVFDTYHLFIKELCDAGLINGLRIDHIDGLFDPESYLIKLRELVGNDFYIIVEKILEADEKLPSHWAAQGTSGYDFLAQVNHLFTMSSKGEEFTQAYENIFPRIPDYEDLVYQKKLFILKERMGGELENLWRYLMSNDLLDDPEPKQVQWKSALGAFLSAFPVYRVYPMEFPLNRKQVQIIDIAYNKALQLEPSRKPQLKYLRSLYQGEAGKDKNKALYFLQRCQQYSGPLAAKGVEDTSFYIYNRLIAHNEVGDSPGHFGITSKDFHQKMINRKKDFPLSVNATSTHDTKRGEDSRMRLLVLSEIPGEWFSKVEEWQKINSGLKQNSSIPDNNEEYFIYQTIVGALPFKEENDFISRTCEYLQKVLREAKVHSNWANPDEEYEKKVLAFVTDILNNPDFRSSLDPFVKKISGYGAIRSLGQSLIKITAPGIPDIYQGTELWDLSYVDPDNRRPVDYGLRMNYIADFRSYSKTNLKKKLSSLRLNFRSGKIKMFVINKALIQRRKDKELYQKGEYFPLNIKGEASENFIAYARILGNEWRIVVVPIVVTPLFNHGNLKPEKELLKDLILELPANSPTEWDFVFTGNTIFAEDGIFLCNALAEFPVVLIKNRKQTWN